MDPLPLRYTPLGSIPLTVRALMTGLFDNGNGVWNGDGAGVEKSGFVILEITSTLSNGTEFILHKTAKLETTGDSLLTFY